MYQRCRFSFFSLKIIFAVFLSAGNAFLIAIVIIKRILNRTEETAKDTAGCRALYRNYIVGGEFHVSCIHSCFQSYSSAWPCRPIHAVSSSSVDMLLIGYANHHGVMLAICYGTGYRERGTETVCSINSLTVFL